MKILLVLLIFVSGNASCWELTNCIGTQDSRISGLLELGKYAEEYKKAHGKIPVFMNEYDEEFEKGIPKTMRPYSLSNDFFRASAETNESIDYWCNLPPRKGEIQTTEICAYLFKTKSTRCTILGEAFTPDKS